MNDAPLNPVQIEHNIRTCAERIHEGVSVCTERERTARKARRDYDAMFAQAYTESSGPAHEKRYRAELATRDMRAEAEEAEVVYKYADRTAKALENELRAWQSVGASVRSMYSVETGVGR